MLGILCSSRTATLPAAANTAVNIPGFAYFGKTPFSVVNRIENQNQLQDNFTYTHGAHTFKTGIDLRYIPINILQGQLYGGGDYSFGVAEQHGCFPALVGLAGILSDPGLWAWDSAVVCPGHRQHELQIRSEGAGRVSAGQLAGDAARSR